MKTKNHREKLSMIFVSGPEKNSKNYEKSTEQHLISNIFHIPAIVSFTEWEFCT